MIRQRRNMKLKDLLNNFLELNSHGYFLSICQTYRMVASITEMATTSVEFGLWSTSFCTSPRTNVTPLPWTVSYFQPLFFQVNTTYPISRIRRCGQKETITFRVFWVELCLKIRHRLSVAFIVIIEAAKLLKEDSTAAVVTMTNHQQTLQMLIATTTDQHNFCKVY